MARYSTNGPMDNPIAEEVDTFFLTMNNRLRPDQLQPGQVAMSQNGRMDVDGAWQPRKGINAFGPVLGDSGQGLTIPFYVYDNVAIASASRVDELVSVTTGAAHGIVDGTQVFIGDISGTVDPTGNRIATVTGATTFTFEIAGATGNESYVLGAAPIVGSSEIAPLNIAYGSCRFSNPADDNAEYIITAMNPGAKAVNLLTEAATDIAYPAGLLISTPVEMLQAFGKVYIFREGATALEWNGSFSGTPAFTKVANGAYTQPFVLTAPNNAACSGGVVTVTNTHNLSVGDTVTIFDEGTTGLVRFDKYRVASISTTVSFTFFASIDDFSATSVVLGVRQSNGRGFSHMPAPKWATYHQRRMIVPFAYTTSGASGSEVVTARNVSDELLFSDVLDGDTYDLLQNNFRVTAGIADYIQNVHPFTDDTAIAFNRNSLHLITGLSGSLADLSIKEITREFGLVAPKSVVTIGNSVYFLSDNGVYSAEFGDLYNLRGAQRPKSDEINPIIKRINPLYAHRAVATFHDNRYYLAFPLDDSIGNNAIVVYNILNQGWESLDIVETRGWDVSNLIVASPTDVNKLYAVNSFGGINVLDERIDDNDVLFTFPGVVSKSVPIDAEVVTRSFTLGSVARKSYKEFELHVESTEVNTSDADVGAEAENTDETLALTTLSALNGGVNVPAGEDASLRGRIGSVRSYGLQIIVSPTAGRPKLRMVRISGSEAHRSTTLAT